MWRSIRFYTIAIWGLQRTLWFLFFHWNFKLVILLMNFVSTPPEVILVEIWMNAQLIRMYATQAYQAVKTWSEAISVTVSTASKAGFNIWWFFSRFVQVHPANLKGLIWLALILMNVWWKRMIVQLMKNVKTQEK